MTEPGHPRDPAPPRGPFGLATLVASAVFLGAGVVAPQAAEALLRLFVVTLAVGFVVARGYAAFLPSRMTQDFYSPFDGPGTRTTPPAAPEALRKLMAELQGADNRRAAERMEIPRAVRWLIIDEAARRLTDRQRLDLSNPADHEAIRALVSAPTWELIRPSASGPPLSRLALILDDVEEL